MYDKKKLDELNVRGKLGGHLYRKPYRPCLKRCRRIHHDFLRTDQPTLHAAGCGGYGLRFLSWTSR